MSRSSTTVAGNAARAGNGKHADAPTQVTFLEAIRQAMFEEMERDPAVVLLGEDVGVYGGAFKTSEGLLERFGWERVIDTPIAETAIHRLLLQPDHQLCGEVALPMGCAGALGGARTFRRRRARRAVSFRESGNVLRAHAGAKGGLSVDAP